jgi:hypothetical protein
MMITLNSNWSIPGESFHEDFHGETSFLPHHPAPIRIQAAFGIEWKPTKPLNDNLPSYLRVIR